MASQAQLFIKISTKIFHGQLPAVVSIHDGLLPYSREYYRPLHGTMSRWDDALAFLGAFIHSGEC